MEHIECLPATLREAVCAFESDEFIQGVLGKHISENYISAKKAEWDSYRTQVTGWELEQYLYKI